MVRASPCEQRGRKEDRNLRARKRASLMPSIFTCPKGEHNGDRENTITRGRQQLYRRKPAGAAKRVHCH
jgi:hypothetical protein